MCFLSNLRQRWSSGHLLFLLFFVAKNMWGQAPFHVGTGPEGTGCQRTVSSSSQRVVARFESFDRFIFHDFSPMPSDAENTLPWP